MVQINVGSLLNGFWATNVSAISVTIHPFSLKKISLKMPSTKWLPFFLSLHISLVLPSFCWQWKVPCKLGRYHVCEYHGALCNVVYPSETHL